jgi:hypothetical protein
VHARLHAGNAKFGLAQLLQLQVGVARVELRLNDFDVGNPERAVKRKIFRERLRQGRVLTDSKRENSCAGPKFDLRGVNKIF